MSTTPEAIVVHPTNSDAALSPIVLDRWQESLVKMDEFHAQAESLYASARQLEVKDADSFAKAGEQIAAMKQAEAESEACMEPYKLKVRRVLDFIQQKFNRNKNRISEGRAILTTKMQNYSRMEKEAAAKEAAKLNKGKAVDERVIVQPNLPKTTGVRTTTNYPITVENPKELIRDLLRAYKRTDTARVQFLSQFVTLDEGALARYAKEQKDPAKFNREIPGVKCEEKTAFGGKV